jgi:hypothetical protein
MNNYDWRTLDVFEDPNEAYNQIETVITDFYTQSRSEHRVKVEVNGRCDIPRKPWINKFIIDRINYKNDIWAKLKKNKDNTFGVDLKVIYSGLKKEVECLIKHAKSKYYGRILENAKGDSRKIWEQINKITGNKGKVNLDDLLIKNFKGKKTQDIANNFNVCFAAQVPNLRKKFEKRFDTINGQNTKMGIGEKISDKTISLGPASIEEISNILRTMKVTDALGCDNFNIRHFQDTNFNSSIMFTKLINKIIDKEIWPENLKIQLL